MNRNYYSLVLLLYIFHLFTSVTSFPDEGKWDQHLNQQQNKLVISKSLYKNSEISIKVTCDAKEVPTNLTINWIVLASQCWDYRDTVAEAEDLLVKAPTTNTNNANNSTSNGHVKTSVVKCEEHIASDEGRSVTKVPKDAVYVMIIQLSASGTMVQNFNASVHVEMRGDYGYLSAADWPLLPFYGTMCGVYVVLGLVWLIVSFLQWRDLLRVQFCIGGVILLGMLEKATFLAQYESINYTGRRVIGAMLLAEWVSCGKRTLARMLVVIVSLGFGIVKPRLGAALHRVVAVGLLYFSLAAAEAYLRVIRPMNDGGKQLLVASVPLAILDSAICWWIFTALVNTTRTLRLRRNEVKLQLYRHFTNTLIFAVGASVVFMAYSIRAHKLAECLTAWRDLWLDDAYWHLLFSSILVVIMLLWRPTNNNQRYAFMPLLDSADDEEEEQLVSDAYGVKVRLHARENNTPRSNNTGSLEEDLRWLDEHIPASDPALPVLDSDEEMVNTRFEVSKMQ